MNLYRLKDLKNSLLQGRGRYVNHVVIQANPIIMQVIMSHTVLLYYILYLFYDDYYKT